MERDTIGNILHRRIQNRLLRSEETEQNGKETAEKRQEKDL